MFKLNYRIVEDLNILKGISKESFDIDYNCISGYFRLMAGEQCYGDFYHENPLQEGEVGMELLDLWLELLLEVLVELKEKKYIAFQVPDMAYLWLELKRQNDTVMINSYTDNNIQDGYTPTFRTEAVEGITSNYDSDYQVDYIEFSNSIIKTVEDLISDLQELNVELVKTEMIERLLQGLKAVKTT
jgi:hypothetical protein